jgi:hypothetical protein
LTKVHSTAAQIHRAVLAETTPAPRAVAAATCECSNPRCRPARVESDYYKHSLSGVMHPQQLAHIHDNFKEGPHSTLRQCHNIPCMIGTDRNSDWRTYRGRGSTSFSCRRIRSLAKPGQSGRWSIGSQSSIRTLPSFTRYRALAPLCSHWQRRDRPLCETTRHYQGRQAYLLM